MDLLRASAVLIAALATQPALALDTWWVAHFDVEDDPVDPDPELGRSAAAIETALVELLAASAPTIEAHRARLDDPVDHQSVTAAYWAALAARPSDALVSGTVARKAAGLELTVAVWSAADRTRRARVVQRLAGVDRAQLTVVVAELRRASTPRAPGVATTPRAVEPGAAPVQLVAEPPPPVRETTNPWAKGLVLGGSGLVAVGLITGVVTYVGFAAPLEDPQPRSGADNDALLQTGRATGIVADTAVIVGVAAAAAGVVLWLTGVGDEVVR